MEIDQTKANYYPIPTDRTGNKKVIKLDSLRNLYNQSPKDYEYVLANKTLSKRYINSNTNSRSSTTFIPKKSNPCFNIAKNRAFSKNLIKLTQKLLPMKSKEKNPIFFNQTYDVRTKIGTINNSDKSNNQDSYFCIQNFQGLPSQGLYGVCDGHGVFGHLVSSEIKHKFPRLLDKRLKALYPLKDLGVIIKKSIKRIHKNLVSSKSINCDYSGSTFVSIFITDNTLICAFVGDSRAVLGRKIDCNFISMPLSKDHKPENHLERTRIENRGGRVDTLYTSSGNPTGPLRVWIGKTDTPGLAMSRSLGDKYATEVGVIADPEVRKIELSKDDKFIIIASDGL